MILLICTESQRLDQRAFEFFPKVRSYLMPSKKSVPNTGEMARGSSVDHKSKSA